MTAAASAAACASIVRLREVDSTQSHAFALAAGGAGDGTVVVADVQTAGRGRRGHVWRAEPGTSLLCSIVLRPTLPVAALPLLSLTAAVAVTETLLALGVPARIKWPNDVLARGRKLAGILLESRLGAETVVVLGIGVNLHQGAFSPDLAARATSVAVETGRAPAADVVLDALLARFAAWRARLEAEGFGPVRERWLALDGTVGTVVTIDGIAGTARGLDAHGALLVDDGTTMHRVMAGAIDDAARR
jgi:BirA family transcriptional regulator, biotin operon repressor / biotin---[acetyl-CoA-carboxylase] ligase